MAAETLAPRSAPQAAWPRETPEAGRSRRIDILRDPQWQRFLVLLSVPLLVSTHWLYPYPDKQIHNLLYHIDFVPVLAAAMLFGWRTSILATLLTLAAETPQLWVLWPNDPVYRNDQIGETLVAGIAAIVVGFLANRTRRQTARLEVQSRELEAMNVALQSNMERLKKAERMYAVARMAASLAHEIRNPLSGIAGAAGILKRRHANATNMEECCDIIDKESQRLNKLLADFLSFARPRPPRLQPTDLTAVIDSVIALARHSGRAAGITFNRNVDVGLPEVQCDSEQIKQVLVNLVMNAVDATGNGCVHLAAACREGTVWISVADEGTGIPPAQEDRIFEPFFTTKETGSGLGLAIAAQIVESHGGTLRAQNNPGSGLKMVLQFPIAPAVRVDA